MAEPLTLAVVGHTNAGKTSLLRTLTRRRDFGQVDARPGTTRHAEAVTLQVDGAAALRFVDTPGLEDSTGLLALLHQQDRQLPPPQRLRLFLRSEAAQGPFEQEAKVLRAMLDADAVFYVVDAREAVLPKYRSELEILSWCARPVMPVLNFVHAAASRDADWTRALSDYGLHAVARFDAVAPYVGAELRLYRDLATLLRPHEAVLGEVCESLEFERLNRRAAGHTTVAELLVAVASARQTLSREQAGDARQRGEIVEAFRAGIVARVRAAVDALLEIYAFGADEAHLALVPWLDGRWADELFNAETLKHAGKALGTGALVGASVGVAADLALAGLSLGTGAAIGAALGGAASQGFGAVGRTLTNKLRGRIDLSVEDEVLALIAEQLGALMLTLERRGHAAQVPLVLRGAIDAVTQQRSQALLALLQPARAHPDWALPHGTPAAGRPPGGATRRSRRADTVVAAVVQLLRQQAAAAEPP